MSARVIAILIFATTALCAQEYSFRYLGTADGLENLAVRQIYQDRTGFIWVSTENGIYRYDGERFEAFGPRQGLPNTSGAAFGDAPDGSLLAGGDFGLYRLVGNRFEKIQGSFTSVNWAQGIAADGKGHTFVGTDNGLVELSSQPGRDGFVQRTFPQALGTSGPGAYAVMVDGETLWYGCANEVCRMDAHGTKVFGPGSGLPDRNWQAILTDRDGNLWVRGRNVGVFEMAAGKSRFVKPASPMIASALNGAPHLDADGRILLLSPDGLFIRARNGWQKVDRSAGLHGTVYAAFEDRQSSLWLGMAGRGVVQWQGYREWESYSAASGLGSDVVYEILPRPDGSIWVATEGGLFHGEPKQFGIEWKQFAGVGRFPVHSLQMDESGDLWIGTESHGAAHIHLVNASVEWFGDQQGLTDRSPYTIRFDRERRLWAATAAGLFVAAAPYRRFTRIAEIPAIRIWSVAEGSDGTIWAGGADGLYQLAGGRWKHWTPADGLSNREVLSLAAAPSGVIWAGYRLGGAIDRIHPRPGGAIGIEKGVQRPGSDGLVYFLGFDAAGRLWTGTEHGVDMWNGVHWSHYDMSDGLAWNDCDLNAFAQGPDGAIWIGTAGGLSRFKPLPQNLRNAPLQVVFTRLLMGQTDVSGLRNPSFPAQTNSLVARYSALNAQRENGVVFRYRLEGAGADWTETGQSELQFARLAPGTYRLQVEAQDAFGAWSGKLAEFSFRILAPWYETRWFILLCFFAPLVAVLAAHRMRTARARMRERELVLLVEEKTAGLRRANDELLRLSFTDPLTGLANRREFDRTLEGECLRMTRAPMELSLLSIDVDHFKALNDTLGHQRGDEYLMYVAAELIHITRRAADLAARYGGEEFAVLLSETGAIHAMQLAESLRLRVERLKLPNPGSSVAPFLTISIGVATAASQVLRTPGQMFAAADQALYKAKRLGRNRVVTADWGAVEVAPEEMLHVHLT